MVSPLSQCSKEQVKGVCSIQQRTPPPSSIPPTSLEHNKLSGGGRGWDRREQQMGSIAEQTNIYSIHTETGARTDWNICVYIRQHVVMRAFEGRVHTNTEERGGGIESYSNLTFFFLTFRLWPHLTPSVSLFQLSLPPPTLSILVFLSLCLLWILDSFPYVLSPSLCV
jgi:hypothetical protein